MTVHADSQAITEAFLDDFLPRYLDAWNGHDAAAIAPLLDPEIEWHDPALPAPARGVAEVQAFMRDSWRGFPDLSFTSPEPSFRAIAGDQAVISWTMEGTCLGPIDPPGYAPTGRRIRVDGLDQWRFHEGRIRWYRAYYDAIDMARQLGIVPPAGSGAERAAVGFQRLQARFQRRRR